MGAIKDFFRNIKWWVINVYTFRKTLWNGRPWDFTLLYMAMADSLESMEDCHLHHGRCVNNEKYAKQMRTTRLILKRLIEDDYLLENVTWVEDKSRFLGGTFISKNDVAPSRKHSFAIAQNVQKNDLRLLAKMLEKHSLKWWD